MSDAISPEYQAARDEFQRGRERQRQSQFSRAAAQMDTRFAIDPSGVKKILEADPEGPARAAEKLSSAVMLSRVMGYDLDYTFANVDEVGRQYMARKAHTGGDVSADHWADFRANQLQIDNGRDWDRLARLEDTMRKLQRAQTNGGIQWRGNPWETLVGELGDAADFIQAGTIATSTGGYDQAMQQAQAAIGKIRDRINERNNRMQSTGRAYQGVDYILHGAGTIGQSVLDSLPEMAAGAAVGMAAGGLVGIGTGAARGAASQLGGFGVRQGLASGLQFGAQSGIFGSSSAIEGGGIYGELIESGVSHETANTARNLVGTVNGLIESAEVMQLTGLADGIITRAVTNAVKKGVQRVTSRGLFAAAGRELAARWAVGTVEETTQEVLQETSTILGTAIAQEIDSDLVDPKDRLTAYQAVNRILETAMVSAAGMGLIGLPGAVIRTGVETAGMSKRQQAMLETIRRTPDAAPEIQRAVQETILDEGRIERFQEAQESPETATVFRDDEGPQVFYHGAGAAEVFEDPADAAATIAGRVHVSPGAFVAAVRQKYGQSAAEWAQSLMEGKEQASDAAMAAVGDQAQSIRESAAYVKRGEIDLRPMTDQVQTTFDALGLKPEAQDVLQVNLDVRNGRVWTGTRSQYDGSGDFDAWHITDEGRVILRQGAPEIIVPIGTAPVKAIRIPTVAGRIQTRQTEGALEALDPDTGDVLATLEHDNGRVTKLPDNPHQARQLLQALADAGTEYTLDIPQEQRDAILMTDRKYRNLQADLYDLDRAQRELGKKLKEAEAAGQLTEETLAAIESQSSALDAQADALVQALGEYEARILGEPYLQTAETVQAFTEEAALRNDHARARLMRQLTTAAPQLAGVAPALVRLMEITANARGMTLADWSDTYLAPDAFVNIDHLGKRGAVQFLDDGRALINLSSASDPTTVVHELGHIVRRQLAPEDQAALLSHYQAETWTVDAEEAFARDWENYFQEGRAPTPELASIFQRIARFFAQVYGMIRGSLDGEVRSIIDRQLAADAVSQAERVQVAAESLLFQYAGQYAVLTDEQRSLKGEAIAMERAGKPAELIRSKTGWFLGPDGKWRYEIDDSAATVRTTEPGRYRLGELFDHPTLYAAYPPLAEYKVDLGLSDGTTTGGSINHATETITVATLSLDAETVKKVLLHEIQHAIQEFEGFATGGNTDGIRAVYQVIEWQRQELEETFSRQEREKVATAEVLLSHLTDAEKRDLEAEGAEYADLFDEKAELQKAILAEKRLEPSWKSDRANSYQKELNALHAVQASVEERLKRMKETMAIYKRMGARGVYQSLAGEIEARDVAARANYSPLQRRFSRPYSSEPGKMQGALRIVNDGYIDQLFQPAPPTDSEAFRAWFGDSKVVDEEGNPLVVYHGTASVFEAFDTKKAQDKEGRARGLGWGKDKFYFTESEDAAGVAAEYAKIQGKGRSARVLKVYLNISNPISAEDYLGKVQARIELGSTRDRAIAAVDAEIRAAGHDGIVDSYSGGLAVFSPTQIKSVDNTGAWSPDDPRILYQPAYHGTPHRFDRFTTAAMGTGEGNQSYGWGLYFAGKKEVAEHYRESLADSKFFAGDRELQGNEAWAAQFFIDNEKDKQAAISDATTSLKPGETRDEIVKFISSFGDDISEKSGQVYRVEIPDDAEFLDWDKPLSEQSEKVKKAMEIYGELGSQVYPRTMNAIVNNSAAKWIYTSLSEDLGSPERASRDLKAAGIPGIRYLDGASRSDGEGTYNYVIFDDSDVRIVETFYQPEYTMPAETRAIMERIDALNAEGRTASLERQAEIGQELGPLYAAASNAVDLWLHELKVSVDRGDVLPMEALVEAAEYAGWARDELEYRRAMDFMPAMEPDAQADTDLVEAMGEEPEQSQAPQTRKDAEAAFLAELKARPDEILGAIRNMARGIDHAYRTGAQFDDLMAAQAQAWRDMTGPIYSLVNAKDPSQLRKGSSVSIRDIALTSLANNPSRSMRLWALAQGDLEAIAIYDNLDISEPLSETPEAIAEAERQRVKNLPFEDRVVRLREILHKPFSRVSGEEIEAAYAETSLELRRLTDQFTREKQARKDWETRFEGQSRSYEKTMARMREIATELRLTRQKAETAERNDQATIDALRIRRDELKAELRAIKEAHGQELRDYIRSAREEARANTAAAVEKARAELKAAQAKRDELLRAREYKRGLIREILKDPPSTVDYRYAAQINDLQALLDPKKRPAAAARAQAFYDSRPDFVQNILDAIGQELSLEPADRGYSIQELEDILTQIVILEMEGKTKRLEYLDGEARTVALSRAAMLRRLEDTHGQAALERLQTLGAELSAGRKVWNSLAEMQHILDQLDGGALDYTGPFYRAVFVPFQAADKQMQANVARRMAILHDLMAANGIREHEIFAKLKVNGKDFLLQGQKMKGWRSKKVESFEETLTIQTAMGIYMASQNLNSREAVTMGNKVSVADQAAIIKALPEKFRTLADGIIEQIFDPDYDRLAEVHNRVNNKAMGRVDRYYPMVRQAASGQTFEQEMSFDAMARAGTKRSPKDGMTKDRVRIGESMQTPIRLDAIALVMQAVQKQERFIAFAEPAKRLGKIFNGRSREAKPFVDAVDNIRPGTTRQVLSWAARAVNMESSQSEMDRAIMAMKYNLSSFAMGYNVRTAVNNLSGLPLYLGETTPASLLGSSARAMTGGFQAMRKRMDALAPEMHNRIIERAQAMRPAARSLFEYGMEKFRGAGFWLMRNIVETVDTIGWNACFEGNLRLGMTEQDAALAATAAVLRTQPSGSALAMSDAEASTMGSILAPFASQSYKIWNQLIHLPNTKRAGAVRRYVLKWTGAAVGSAMFATMIPLASKLALELAGEGGEDDQGLEDMFNKILSAMFLSNIPWFGGVVASKAEGYTAKHPFDTQLAAIDGIYKLLHDKDLTDEDKQRVAQQFGKSIFALSGLPYVAGSRIIEAAAAGDDGAVRRIIHGLFGGTL